MSHIVKPSKDEDEYFAREEAEKLRQRAFEQRSALADSEREALRVLHHLKCPNCGLNLQTVKHGSVDVDTCFNCHGVFLHAGELAKILKDEHEQHRGTVMKAILNLFAREAGP